MKTLRSVYIFLASFFVLVLLGFYVFFLYGIPKILSSENNLHKYEKMLRNKSSMLFIIKGLKVKTYPDLRFIISAKEISILPLDNAKSLNIEKISYSARIYNLAHGNLDVGNVYVNVQELKKYNFKSNKQNKPFKFKFFPLTNINHAFVSIDEDSKVMIDYIKSYKIKHDIHTKILATIKTPETKYPVYIGKDGEIIYKDKIIFDNFSVELQNSKIYLSGDKNKLNIKASGLPADELEKNFIYFYKLRHPNKKNFIENFTNFRGTLDVDLTIKNGKFYGKCITRNLAALFSDFKIDVVLPETVFNFNKKHVSAATTGLFGTEPVQTDFDLEGIATDDLHVKGNVHSILTNKFTKKYFPILEIHGGADAKVRYVTHNQVVDVFYTLGLNKGNNISSSYGELGNTDKIRRATMQTHKNGDPMDIKSYEYSILKDGKWVNIFGGDGSFKKIGKRYKLSDISLKTNGTIPFAYVQSVTKNYIKNGTFNSDLRYDNINHTILGTLNLYNVSHSDFLKLKEANINLNKDNILFKSNGTFFGSPIFLNCEMDKNIGKKILIKNIAVHLYQFYAHKVKLSKKTSNTVSKKKSFRPDVIVEHGKITVDRIYSSQFEVKNTNIYGNLKNNVVHFVMPKADYAKGVLSAKGIYNISDHSSDINFSAYDIDSNDVVTNFFKLPDYAKGRASATLHLRTKNKLNDVKADAAFSISDGSLPKIGSREFHLGSSKKTSSIIGKKLKNMTLSLSKITNIDFSKPDVARSNLYGAFKLDNDTVKDAKIFSKSKYVAVLIEGVYSIDTQVGELCIWGKRNKTKAKKIRVFKIPLNLLYKIVFRPEHSMDLYQNKISQIPEIEASLGDEVAIFRVLVKGKLNSKNSKDKIIELKDLR